MDNYPHPIWGRLRNESHSGAIRGIKQETDTTSLDSQDILDSLDSLDSLDNQTI